MSNNKHQKLGDSDLYHDEDSQKTLLPPINKPHLFEAIIDDEELGDSIKFSKKIKTVKKKERKAISILGELGKSIDEFIDKQKPRLGQVLPSGEDKQKKDQKDEKQDPKEET